MIFSGTHPVSFIFRVSLEFLTSSFLLILYRKEIRKARCRMYKNHNPEL